MTEDKKGKYVASLTASGGSFSKEQMEELTRLITRQPKGQTLEIVLMAGKVCPTCGRPFEEPKKDIPMSVARVGSTMEIRGTE
jgi:hypothetical protein